MDNNQNTTEFEKVLEKAFKIREEGKSLPDVLKLFPSYAADLQEMFSITSWIEKEAKEVEPSARILENILKRLPSVEQPVTKTDELRYSLSKGRVLEILNQASEFFGSQKLKVWIPVGGVAVIIILIGFSTSSVKDPIAPNAETFSLSSAEITSDNVGLKATSLRTGNAGDESVESILSSFPDDSQGESAVTAEADSDSKALARDLSATEVVTSYDENEI